MKFLEIFRFNGMTTNSEPSAAYNHGRGLSLASYQNSPFITGNNPMQTNTGSIQEGFKTEILDYENQQWNEAAEYPWRNGGDR